MSAPTLYEIQLRFQHLLKEEFRATSPDWLGGRDTPPITYQRRIGIYHAAAEMRFQEALQEDFPQMYQVLGDQDFGRLLRAYLNQFPSRYHSICEVGQHFAEFFLSPPAGIVMELLTRHPYLSDLAAYEWTRNLAYWAVEFPPLKLEEMQSSAAEAPESVVLELHPSVFLVESSWQVDRLGTSRKLASRDGVKLMVSRQNGRVTGRRLGKKPWALLREIAKGTSLGNLEECLNTHQIKPDEALRLIASWVSNQVIGSFRRQNK